MLEQYCMSALRVSKSHRLCTALAMGREALPLVMQLATNCRRSPTGCAVPVHNYANCEATIASTQLQVDPYEPNRVWFTVRTTGTHTGTLKFGR